MPHQVVVLANSDKHGGRCVAGRLTKDGRVGPWVRPVGQRPGGELLLSEIELQTGGYPQPLDVVDISLVAPCPDKHQQENWLNDQSRGWFHDQTLQPTQRTLESLRSPDSPLWTLGFSSSRGFGNRVPEELLGGLPDSLRFIGVEAVDIQVLHTGYKWAAYARFHYLDDYYVLDVTCGEFGPSGLGPQAQTLQLGPCYLTVSLGEVFHGFAYKLVAAIVPVT